MKVLLGFAYGHRGQEPGLSNEDMARYAVDHWSEYDCHSFQGEIALASQRLGFTPEHEVRSTSYLNTGEVAKLQLDELVRQGYNLSNFEYHVLCHDPHWSGCKWFLRKELISRGVIKPCIVHVPAQIRYDKQSYQFWTRGSVIIWIPKILRGIESLLKGEVRLQDVVVHFWNFILRRDI